MYMYIYMYTYICTYKYIYRGFAVVQLKAFWDCFPLPVEKPTKKTHLLRKLLKKNSSRMWGKTLGATKNREQAMTRTKS